MLGWWRNGRVRYSGALDAGVDHLPSAALEGVKVLDLTHHVAGPYCTKLLADFGADVVKVERPGGGDPARRMGPFLRDEPHPDKSLLFLYLNTSKRSVTLDLRSDTGRRILKELVARADALVENFSPRVLPSLGLGYQALKRINSRLVMVSISNFGQTGPYRDFKATDIVQYAMGGLMNIFGSSDREPLKHALHQAQFRAGTNAAIAATTALYQQQMAGCGQRVDVSIQECIASGLRDIVSLYTYTGAIKGRPPPHGGEFIHTAMKVKDGYVVPVSFGGVDWDAIADLLDAPELKRRGSSAPKSPSTDPPQVDQALALALGKWEKFELFREAHKRRRLIYGVVHSPEELLQNPQYRAREYFVDVGHPATGALTYPGAPLLMSETPWRVRSPAPTIGQHNREVLCGRLGYSLHDLGILRASGVI